MRLEEIMSTKVKTIEESAMAADAREKMTANGIHHLIVTRDGKPTGILSDRDIGGRRYATALDGKTVGELMSPGVVSAQVDTTVREAANLLRGRIIGCLPVYRNKALAGIVTVTDLLETIGCNGVRPTWKEEDQKVKYMHQRKGRLASRR